MTAYNELAAIQGLLNDLLAEQDKEALRARITEGPFPERPDGKPYAADFPFEELTIGVVHTVAILAEQLYIRMREQFPLAPGSRIVTSSHITHTWRGPIQPADASQPTTPPEPTE